MNRRAKYHRQILVGCLAAALGSDAVAQSPRAEEDLTRLAEYSAATARLPERAACPPVFSMQPERDAALQKAFIRLLEAGAPRVAGLYAVDEQAVREFLGAGRPPARRWVVRLHQDLEAGRFLAGPELESPVDGISAAAWFFYNNYFAAYAGLHAGFRRADSPLARGAAALAALGNTRLSNLALLSDWLPEAALAALVFNADPELPGALTAADPADEGLHGRLAAALGRAGLANSPDKTALALGAPVLAIATAPFELRRLLPDAPAARDQLWTFALKNIAHPGLLAAIGSTLWTRRAPEPAMTAALDEIASARMLTVVEQDLQARGVAPTNAARQAAFDAAALPAIFGFIWTYRPEFAAWRKAALDAAALPEENSRNARLRDLERELAAMLTPGDSAAVPPAARLCGWLAAAPPGAGSQPQIALTCTLRPPAPAPEGQPEPPPRMAVRLMLTWRIARPLPWGDDPEEIVFAGAAGELLPGEDTGELDKIRVAFVRPGLEAGRRRPETEIIRFSEPELRRFAESLQRVRRSWDDARWGAAQVRNAEQFRRLMILYYGVGFSSAGRAEAFAAACLPASGWAAPAWAEKAFQEWLAARTVFLEQGNPEDLYEWAGRYMLLLALAYTTGNTACGDDLLDDFLGVALTLALEELPEQPGRPRFFNDPRWSMAVAWHWSRDVVSIVRNGGDGRRVWTPLAAARENVFQKHLPVLAGPGGADSFYRPRGGEVELGGLWTQLYKVRTGAAAPAASAGVADDINSLAAIAAGAGEYRFSYLLAAPTQDPSDIFSLAPFGDAGPYAHQAGLRAVLGIRAGLRE